MAEGMHFIVPWFEWPYIYDVRTKPRNVQVRGRVVRLKQHSKGPCTRGSLVVVVGFVLSCMPSCSLFLVFVAVVLPAIA